MYATPASASIDLSIGGEAKLTGSMSECGPADASITPLQLVNAQEGTSTAAGALDAQIVAWNAASTYADARDTDSFTLASPCGGADRSGIDWGFGKELSIGASGTLANGLGVSFSDTLDLTDTGAETGAFELVLDSAVGSLTFKDGAASAVDAAMVTGKKNLDVNGNNLGAHKTETDGSAGMGILWNAPSVGNLDLYVGWAPNSGGDGLDDAGYENTFSIGAVMTAGDIEIGAGYEAASSSNAACGEASTDYNTANVSLAGLANAIYGGDYCGDQTLMYIGATMSAADIGFSAGYSIFDTDEADLTVMSIGASTSMGAYDVAIDYRTNSKDYLYQNAEDTQAVVAVELGTSLGDGVDLGVVFSTSDVSMVSEQHVGDTNYYFAEASLTVGF
jgi:hypothetical protein